MKRPAGRQVVERLGERWSKAEKEAAVWKTCADAAACGHLLVDLTTIQLTRLTPLLCLSPDSLPILPDPLPSDLESSDIQAEFPPQVADVEEEQAGKPTDVLSTFDDSHLNEKQRDHFLRNVRAVEAVLNGATLREAAAAVGMGRSTLSRLVQRTVEFGQVACVPHATYRRERELHPAFQQTIRLLYSRPTKLSLRAKALACGTQACCFTPPPGYGNGHRASFLRSGEEVHSDVQPGAENTPGAWGGERNPARTAVSSLLRPLHTCACPADPG